MEDLSDFGIAKFYISLFPEHSNNKEISIRLSDILSKEYMKAATLLSKHTCELDEHKKDVIVSKACRMYDIASKLKSHKFKQSIIKEIKTIR